MTRFLRLLRKDLYASRLPMGFLSGITIGIMLFVRLRVSSGAWPVQAAVAAVAIPTFFLPLWLLWQSFQTLRTEWREDTVYTLLVLPVPGWQVMLSKLLSILAEYTVLFVVTVGGVLVFFSNLLQPMWETLPGTSWVIWNGFIVYLGSLAALAGFVIFVQLAFMVSKMIGKVQGLVAIWVWVLATWFVSRVGILLEPLFRWVPALPVHELFRLQELDQGMIIQWNLAPQIGVWLATLGLFYLTSYLFEHYVEITG